ncbi:MAG: FHA domain-containing protein [Planctomycetes bacterium]|nr:FHA domain-containing protein [Planctomycetota bacterium]
MLQPLSHYREKALALSATQFSAFCPHPVFVVEPYEEMEDTSFRTMQVRIEPGSRPGLAVAPIKKRAEANAFTMMITLGRASNNDIPLNAKGVSKFHAYVRADGGGYTLTDAGSSYGTEVAGRALQPRVERAPLRTGDVVRLGQGVRMTFVAAADAQRALGEWGG